MTTDDLRIKIKDKELTLLEFAKMAENLEDNPMLCNMSKTLLYTAQVLEKEIEKAKLPIKIKG